MPKPKWKKDTLNLKKRNAWRAKAGYKIFVADRGAVSFSVPRDWTMEIDTISTKFYDLPTEEEANCRLECSYLRLPPIDWSGLPLPQLIQEAYFDGDERGLVPTKDVTQLRRDNLEIAWAEYRFTDPNEQREAFSRVCMGRGSNIQALITFDYWTEEAPRMNPVWDEVMRSLQLGRYIQDPTLGI